MLKYPMVFKVSYIKQNRVLNLTLVKYISNLATAFID